MRPHSASKKRGTLQILEGDDTEASQKVIVSAWANSLIFYL